MFPYMWKLRKYNDIFRVRSVSKVRVLKHDRFPGMFLLTAALSSAQETDAADLLLRDKFIVPLFIDYEGVDLFHNHAVYRSSVVDLLICHWPPDTDILEGIWLLLSKLSSETFDYNNQIQQPNYILPEPYVLFMRQFSVPIENILLRILKIKREVEPRTIQLRTMLKPVNARNIQNLILLFSEALGQGKETDTFISWLRHCQK